MKNNHTPEIRFLGFTGDWDQHSLDSIVDRVKSYSLSRDVETSECTGYKYIHYGDIHTKVADIIDESSNLPNIKAGNYELLQKGDLVLADASEDYQGIAKPAVITIDMPYKLVSGLHTIALRPKQADSLFLYYLINSPTFRKYGYKTGTGMKVFGISVTNLLKFEGMFPGLEEQAKIGIFLRHLDDTITLHEQELNTLKQTEQGFLQKMFPKEGESVPEVRFPGFTGDWEQRKLGEISDKVTEKNIDNIYSETLTNSAELGIINQRDYFDKDISNEKNLDGYYIVRPDDFVYNPRISNFAPVGPIKRNKLGRTGVMSPLYYVFRTHGVDETYLEKYFSSHSWHRFMKLNGDSGARSDRFAIKDSIFREMLIPIPSIDEQTKISSFFKQLDDTIELHHRELDALKETKKAFLQKMFA